MLKHLEEHRNTDAHIKRALRLTCDERRANGRTVIPMSVFMG